MSRRKKTTPPSTPPPVTGPVADDRIGRGWLLGIFLAALAYRALCFADTAAEPLYRFPVVDAGQHDAWAGRIVAGDRWGHGPDDVFKPPLYPYFLAGLYGVFGRHVALVQWAQFTLGALSCVFLALLTARLLGQTAGRVAGLLAAGYAPYVFFESQLLTPALSIFLNLAAILLLISPGKTPSYGRLVAAGVLLGLSAGVRPDVLLPACLVVAYLLPKSRPIKRRQLAAAALCVAAGAIIVILPIGLRNYRLTRQFIPVSGNGGINFYVGNSAAADGITAVPVGLRWERLIARVPQETLEKPAAASRWWTRAAWGEIAAVPGSAMLRWGRKGLAFFNRREFRNNICYHFMQQDSALLAASPGQFAVILPLAVCGLVGLWRSGDDLQRRAFFLCVLWVGGYWAVGVVFFVTARFRLPAVPLLILPAAWGLTRIVAAIRQRQQEALLGYAAVVCAVGVLCWPLWLGRPQDGWVRDYVNLGNSLRDAQDPDGAIKAYQQALARRPDDPDAHYLLGRMLLPKRVDQALEHLQAAQNILPNSPDVLLAMGEAYLARGDAAQARQTFHELLDLAGASNLWPKRAAWATAHIHLAALDPEDSATHWEQAWFIDPRTAAEVAWLRRRELARVLDTFQAEATEKPFDWYARANYGMALLASSRADEAVTQLRQAARLAPQREGLRFQLAKALLQTGRKEEAASLLDQLVKELPRCGLRDQAEALRRRLRAGS